MGTSRRKPGPALAQSFPISVIVPAYNAAEFLPRTIPALLANDLSSVELLVVDDGSTDQTAKLLASWERQGLIRVARRGTRQGPAAARNLGAALASHPYLLFVDADVELPPKTVEWVRDSLDLYGHRPEVAGVLGCYTDSVPHRGFPSRFRNRATIHLYRKTETVSPFLHTSIFAIRKRVLLEAGGFDETLLQAEDFRLGLALGSRGYRFVIDWRIRGTHLKRYSWTGILREDWQRVATLSRIRLTAEERRFSWRAHRWNRLAALAVPGLALLALGSTPWSGWVGVGGLLTGLLLHLMLHAGFLGYGWRREGLGFAVTAAGFLFIELLWAELALVVGKLTPRAVGPEGPRS